MGLIEEIGRGPVGVDTAPMPPPAAAPADRDVDASRSDAAVRTRRPIAVLARSVPADRGGRRWWGAEAGEEDGRDSRTEAFGFLPRSAEVS